MDLAGASIGQNVVIHPMSKIVHQGANLIVGDYSQIDDFAFINAGRLCHIGKFVHISSFVSVIGGGEFIMEDFSGLSVGCRIVTGTDDFANGFLSNPTVPTKYKHVTTSKIIIGRHSIVGSNAVILPGITIGEGATVGAGCIVQKDLKPWGIYVGFNPKKIGEREREGVYSREKALLSELRKGHQN